MWGVQTLGLFLSGQRWSAERTERKVRSLYPSTIRTDVERLICISLGPLLLGPGRDRSQDAPRETWGGDLSRSGTQLGLRTCQ